MEISKTATKRYAPIAYKKYVCIHIMKLKFIQTKYLLYGVMDVCNFLNETYILRW